MAAEEEAAAAAINTRRRIVTRIEEVAVVVVVEMTIPIEEIREGNKNVFFHLAMTFLNEKIPRTRTLECKL